MYSTVDPRRPEPTHRYCDTCARWRAAALVERGWPCAACRYDRAVVDGDLREAADLADDFGLALLDGEVYARDEAPALPRPGRVPGDLRLTLPARPRAKAVA